ncbi:hypothetical protein [Streptomyces sp. NPDC008150]|uniref:hypothetical protein n=1 Tax=Streptomyces sp. NPDC008150 TaxID=3364816 RepID=UPI0036E9C1A0
MTTSTPANLDKAVVGRRVEFCYHRDLAAPVWHPGVIRSVDPTPEGSCTPWIRLDGRRYRFHSRVDYEGLRYLDEVGPVPDLPMGSFTPAVDHQNGFWEQAGVLFATIGEEGDPVVLTTDQQAAEAAVLSYGEEIGWDMEAVDLTAMRPLWAVFEWGPEDADLSWTVQLDASKDDDQAVHVYHLPI